MIPLLRKYIILSACIFLCMNVRSQSCCCKEAFGTLRQYLEESYAGFELKLSAYSKEHTKLVSTLEKKMKGVPSFSIACLRTLNEYIAFFEDGHLTLNAQLTANTDSVNLFYANAERMSIPADTFKNIINRQGNDPIIGIWKGLDNDPDTRFKITIVPDKNKPGNFTGVLIASAYKYWKPSFIMMRISKEKKGYKVAQYTSRGATQYYYINLNRDKNAFGTKTRIWAKEGAKGQYPDSSAFRHFILTQKNYFKELSAQTNYLSLRVLARNSDTLAKLIDDNIEQIISKKYLIIDIRDNGGGTASGFQKLQNFINDTLPHFAKLDYLTKSSPAIIKGYQKFWKSIGWENEGRMKILQDSVGKTFLWQTEKEKKQKLEWDTAKKIELPNKIRKIIILQNRNVFSAAEMFVNIFSASPKVYFMGMNTGGLIDKVGIMTLYDNIHGIYELNLPVAVRIGAKEHPIDPVGFPPDIYFNSGEKDWIEQAQYLLENNLLPALPPRFNKHK